MENARSNDKQRDNSELVSSRVRSTLKDDSSITEQCDKDFRLFLKLVGDGVVGASGRGERLSSASIVDAGSASCRNDVPPLVQDVGAVLRIALMVIVAILFIADFKRLRRAG